MTPDGRRQRADSEASAFRRVYVKLSRSCLELKGLALSVGNHDIQTI
jgi:hypothetical protein